jgi:hypothetical protein
LGRAIGIRAYERVRAREQEEGRNEVGVTTEAVTKGLG